VGGVSVGTEIHVPETEEQRIAREARLVIAEDMAWDLMGTCSSMIAVAMRRDVVVDDDLEEAILLRAFHCHACGWWHSVEELNNLTQRELCDQCHLEENPVDDYGTPIPKPEPMPKGGGIDLSAIMDEVMRADPPTLVMIVTDVEQDPIEKLRLGRTAQETNPHIDAMVAHVG